SRVPSITTEAPACSASCLRAWATSTLITLVTPAARSMVIVASPIGPAPKTTAPSPMRTPDLRTACSPTASGSTRAPRSVGTWPSGRTMEAGTTVYSAEPPPPPDRPWKPRLRHRLVSPARHLAHSPQNRGGSTAPAPPLAEPATPRCDRRPLGDAGPPRADLGDVAGDLVAELHRVPPPGQRVGRLGRGEDR